MSWTSVWIHIVFTTKYRKPFLVDGIRMKVFRHTKEYGLEKGIQLDVVNGFTDHVHCLVSLNRDQTIADIVKIIKGESSFWINKNRLTRSKFSLAGRLLGSRGQRQTRSARSQLHLKSGSTSSQKHLRRRIQ